MTGSYNAQHIYMYHMLWDKVWHYSQAAQTHPHNEEPEIRNKIFWGIWFLTCSKKSKVQESLQNLTSRNSKSIWIKPSAWICAVIILREHQGRFNGVYVHVWLNSGDEILEWKLALFPSGHLVKIKQFHVMHVLFVMNDAMQGQRSFVSCFWLVNFLYRYIYHFFLLSPQV